MLLGAISVMGQAIFFECVALAAGAQSAGSSDSTLQRVVLRNRML